MSPWILGWDELNVALHSSDWRLYPKSFIRTQDKIYTAGDTISYNKLLKSDIYEDVPYRLFYYSMVMGFRHDYTPAKYDAYKFLKELCDTLETRDIKNDCLKDIANMIYESYLDDVSFSNNDRIDRKINAPQGQRRLEDNRALWMRLTAGNMLGSATTPTQPWLYCDKELDTMHGPGWYDSKVRTYDPLLGIFPQMDPLAEKYHPWSPYVYCMGDPVKNTDQKGEEVINAFSNKDEKEK